ncbi:MAG TPA: hypothetical protein VHM01_17175 [Alphaproteobacteria bacterium]|nr:hypothetical protein [Alphaproteobacteria bacterium]
MDVVPPRTDGLPAFQQTFAHIVSPFALGLAALQRALPAKVSRGFRS